jgi:hypothetical protein
MSSGQFEGGPGARASVLQTAEGELAAEAEQLRAKLSLSRSTVEIVEEIKQTMRMRVGSQNQTVLEVLSEREWAKAFNTSAALWVNATRESFRDAISDFLESNESPIPTRQKRKVADNAWKWDAAADRRERAGSVAPYRGRPETYDPNVLLAFADSIAGVAGCPRFTTGRHGETTLSDDNKGDAPFETFVAAVRWAMVAAWLSAAPPGTPPPTVKREGVLTAFKRIRRSTD